MAAPKENLLSLGHLTSTKQREHSTMKSVNRPMLVQTDFSTLQSQQHLKKINLQQRWQELKERECAAQQHNRQLLLQFEKAQDTLKEMLVRNAAMKTIRVEYEKYLVESSPRWQKQLEEKTQTAQKKCLQQRMEDCLRSYRKITEDELMTKSSANQPLLSQGATKRPQKIAAPQSHSSQEYSNYNQDGFAHLPYSQSSPLTHSQSHTGRFPIRVPFQPHTSSQVPPSFLQHPHPFPLHHLTPTPGHHHHHHHPWLRQDPPGWASPQPDYPWSWSAGAAGIPSGPEALWGQIYMEEPPPESRVSQTVGEDKTSRVPSSKAERSGGSRSSHLSQELDVKPVRLSSGQAESSESGRDSSLASRQTRKRREKRGRTQRSSSDRERCSSQESSSAIVIASAAVAQSSESDASPEKDCNSSSSRTRRGGGLTVGSPRSEKMAKERTSSKGDDSESQHTGEELGSSNEESKREHLGNQSHNDKSESCKEESGSQRDEESRSESVKTENGNADENEKESSRSEESSTEEQDKGEEKKILVAGEDDGDEASSQRDEQQEDRNMEGDDEQVCARNNTTEEDAAEEEMGDQGADEESDSLKKKDEENIKQDSTSSSQDEEEEDESEGSEDKIEEDKEESDEEEDEDGSEGIEDSVGEDEEGSNKEEEGESEDEEEHRRDEEGKTEDRDSDDSIICPQEKRSIQVQVIPEEAAEVDEEEEDKSETGSSNDSNEFSDEDIEDLLAPQEQTKEEKDPKAEEKPKAFPDSMKIFQVERDTSSKTNHPNNSDDFDDFYD